MENFSFRRDFKNIQWKSTIGLNLLRSAIAGVFWFFIGLATHKTATPMLFFPLIYLVIILPFGLFDLFLRDRGIRWAGFVGGIFSLALAVADPIMYILHRTVPRIVPVEKYKFFSRYLVIFVLNNPDIVANEYNVPKEIDRAEVKELLSSRIRLDEEVNFLKEEPEEVIADEETRAGKTRAVGPPKLEISNSIFNFYDLRAGSTSTDTFTISNAGGDKLSGSIKANMKWIKIFQSEIDPTQQKQDVIFQVNTSGLAFGFSDTGTIEIKSNAGTERVNVTISIEAETIASLRKEINIPAMAGLGVLGLAIAVTVIAWQMALKTEKEAKLVKLKTEQKQAQQTNQEKHEYAIAQQKTSTIEQSTLGKKETEKSASQEAVNNCFDTVPPDRWKGEYYNNKNLQGSPSMVRDDGCGSLNFHWDKRSPSEGYGFGIDKGCGIGTDNFSVRWTRTVSFDDGRYRFMITGDGGIRLYIDDQLKLSRRNDQEATTYTTETNIPLPAGKHAIRLEYYENFVGAIAKLSWQMVSTPKQLAAQSPMTYNLTGEWEGKVDNKPVKLSIAQDGNSLSGNIVYDTEFSKTNVKEHLSGEINNDKIVLKGTGYTAKGVTSFSLDTFSGTISSQDGDFIRGNYTDEAGHRGSWFVTKSKSSPQVAAQKSTSNDKILSEDEVKTVIEKRVYLSNKNESIDEVMRYYQDSVDYYDKGFVLKDVIRQEIISNYKMWPDREHRISSSIIVISGNIDNEKTAKFTVHSIVKKGQKILENENNCEITLRKQGNCIRIIREKNIPSIQQTTNNYEPKITIPAQQFRLTEALRKRPFIVIKRQTGRMNFDESLTDAEMEISDSGVISVYTEVGRYMKLDFSWSPDKSAYSGTWSDSRRVCGGIKLWPIYDSEGDIKCFTGYMEQGRGDRNTIIKVKNTFCLCPDPPDHNPSTKDQYRKPKSPSVHTYETNRSYHWGK